PAHALGEDHGGKVAERAIARIAPTLALLIRRSRNVGTADDAKARDRVGGGEDHAVDRSGIGGHADHHRAAAADVDVAGIVAHELGRHLHAAAPHHLGGAWRDELRHLEPVLLIDAGLRRDHEHQLVERYVAEPDLDLERLRRRRCREAEQQQWNGETPHRTPPSFACGQAQQIGSAPASHPVRRWISRSRKASQAAICDSSIYSSARCACSIEPGPQITAGMPASWKSPASVPKEMVRGRLRPVSASASLSAGELGSGTSPATQDSVSVSMSASAARAFRRGFRSCSTKPVKRCNSSAGLSQGTVRNSQPKRAEGAMMLMALPPASVPTL